ncbi:MAG: pyrroline-5-carboxylate reductase [Verrucomicrobiota bacterium]|nr:pyrroline-5-carboxylate reductase [Verrucomicrobiota bacterium]
MLRAGFCTPAEIIAAEPAAELREKLAQEIGIEVTTENAVVAEKVKVIFLGVKPGVVLPVIRALADSIEDKLIVSLAAGIRLTSMEALGPARFARAMTNTPAAVCRAATAIARGARTTDADVWLLREIFSAIGVVEEVREDQIDAVTALAGSGPAFVYSVIEALADGGKATGLPDEVALRLATQTVLGAAQLALESDASPEELRRMVITPGGTTAAGLDAMEKHGTTQGLTAAVKAAAARGVEMAKL